MFTTSKKAMGTILTVACLLVMGSFAASAAASDWNGAGANPYLAYDEYQTIALLDRIERDNPGVDVTARWAGTGNPYLQYGETEIIDVVNGETTPSLASSQITGQAIVNPYLAYGDEESVALMDRLGQDTRMAAISIQSAFKPAPSAITYQIPQGASDYAQNPAPSSVDATM